MKIYHYNLLSRVISTISVVTIIVGCFFHAAFFGLALFGLPFLISFMLWTYCDSTSIKTEGETILIKERKRLFTDKFKFQKKNVIQCKIINQGFVKIAKKGNSNGPLAAFDRVQSHTKAYSKEMIAIQTNKRVIRIGRTFDDNEIKLTIEHLSHLLKKT